jgi:predicted extracellular nuclease
MFKTLLSLFLYSLIGFWLPSVQALTVMEINTEFLWDHLEPHEGKIIGTKKNPPSKEEYVDEIRFFAKLIHQNKADIVSLVEIESCRVAKHVAKALKSTGEDWYVACKKGRDRHTGQDVAALSRTPFIKSSITTFKNFSSSLNGNKIRPSKILGAVTTLPTGEKVAVIVAHLVSKRGNNDAKRLAQAKAVSKARNDMHSRLGVSHAIVMGDMNDTPKSPALRALLVGSVPLTNPADNRDCSYIYRGNCQLIDHILISKSLSGGSLKHIDMPDTYSDHHAIIYHL